MSRLVELEEENSVWDELLRQYGEHGLELKLAKLPSYQRYYKSWPRDGMATRSSMEVAEHVVSDEPTLEEVAVMTQAREAYLQALTPRQRVVVGEKEKGYKPRDIAERLGDENSNKVRWHLFAARRKLREITEGGKK